MVLVNEGVSGLLYTWGSTEGGQLGLSGDKNKEETVL